jgi:hypothetical protein
MDKRRVLSNFCEAASATARRQHEGRENDATGTLNARQIDDAPSGILIRDASIIVTTLTMCVVNLIDVKSANSEQLI